ncbi:hsp78p [Anopheles sinensis]|uniref:Hsp78p n=1 Tax=Anopheles sinensis TaxID=74873 RepID=A0A084VLJ2_ANOSI|nr:hsp78p [Anopheles sinensis]
MPQARRGGSRGCWTEVERRWPEKRHSRRGGGKGRQTAASTEAGNRPINALARTLQMLASKATRISYPLRPRNTHCSSDMVHILASNSFASGNPMGRKSMTHPITAFRSSTGPLSASFQ